MKKIFLLIELLFVSLSAFSYGGVMSGYKGDLHVIKTEYFDILFPDDCRNDAYKIEKVCDDYYREITEKFGYKPYQRFPVFITRQVESENAYFSLAPYNHIGIFLAEVVEGLDAYDKTTEMIFYHELTHAVSLNSKSGFWRGMAFFADTITPSGISLTSFWFEGATVSLESAGKGGRMNDAFFTQYVVEAKLKHLCNEKSFPSWRDVTGARDVYPYGNDAYAFGGAFSLYLQNKYGMEKYAEFWRRAGTFTTLSFCAGIFKKTYGIKMSKAWKDFFEAIPVPEADLSKRLELHDKRNLLSKKGAVISAADSFYNKETKKVHLIWADSLSSAVYYDGKKIISCKGVSNLRFSSDGKSVFVNRLVERSNTKSEDFEYILKTGKKIKLNHDTERFAVTDGARIIKEGLNWSIKYSCDDKTVVYDFGNKMLHSLHKEYEDENKTSYLFTWCKIYEGGLFNNPFVMPLPGKIEIDRKTLNAAVFLESDFNFTGLEAVVPFEDRYAAVTQEFDCKPLRKVIINWNNDELFEISGALAAGGITEKDNQLSDEIKTTEESYNPLKYYIKGVKLPLGLVTLHNRFFEATDNCFLGASFISSNPWLDKMMTLSAGWDPVEKRGGLSLAVNGGDSAFSWKIAGTGIFDGYGFMQSYGECSAALNIWQGFTGTLDAGDVVQVLYGKPDDYVLFTDNRLLVKNRCFVKYSNVHKAAPGEGQYAGFWLQPFVDAYNNDFDRNYYNAGVSAGLRIPGLFPVNMSASLFPDMEHAFNYGVKVQLADFEIQKGIPAVSVYAYRTGLFITYAGNLLYNAMDSWDILNFSKIAGNFSKDDYEDVIRFSAEFVMGPNTSYFSSGNLKITLGTALQYHFYGAESNTMNVALYSNIAL